MNTYCIEYVDGTEELTQASSEAEARVRATQTKRIIRVVEVH